MIYLLRTHYSIGRGIIQSNDYSGILENPDKIGVPNLVDLALKYNLNPCYVVDDSLAGFWSHYKTLKSKGIPLVFGFRCNFVSDATDKSPDSNISLHKNIIFVKNEAGYKKLIKISTAAHVDFYHDDTPRIDYNYYHSLVGDSQDLVLAIPFYDSFLYNNLMTQNQCVPDYRNLKPVVFAENNNLPFDTPLGRAARKFALDNGLEVVDTQTVYYEKPEHAQIYQIRRCMNRKSGKQRTLEKPELPHFASDEFNLVKGI